MLVIDGSGDADNNTVIATVPLGFYPSALAVDSSTHRVYVASGDPDGQVAVIDESGDAENNRVIATVYLSTDSGYPVLGGYPGGYAGGIAVDPSTHDVYVTSADATSADGPIGAVSVIDGSGKASSIRLIDTIPFQSALPGQLAVDPSNHHVYVLLSVPDGAVLVVIDGSGAARHDHRIGGLRLDDQTGDPVVDPSTHDVYVIDYGEKDLLTIDATNDRVVSRIPLEGNPNSMTVGPLTHTLYVTSANGNREDGTVSLVDASGAGSATATPPITVGHLPAAVVVNPSNGIVYVADSGDATISVITFPQADLGVTVTGPSTAADRSTSKETVTVTVALTVASHVHATRTIAAVALSGLPDPHPGNNAAVTALRPG